MKKRWRRQSSRSPATRRIHTSFFAPPVARTHENTLSTKAAQNRMNTDVIWPRAQQTRCNNVTPKPHEWTPPIIPLPSDTPSLHQRGFLPPIWHGLTQTHFPPTPRKTAWQRHRKRHFATRCATDWFSSHSSQKLLPVMHVY